MFFCKLGSFQKCRRKHVVIYFENAAYKKLYAGSEKDKKGQHTVSLFMCAKVLEGNLVTIYRLFLIKHFLIHRGKARLHAKTGKRTAVCPGGDCDSLCVILAVAGTCAEVVVSGASATF